MKNVKKKLRVGYSEGRRPQRVGINRSGPKQEMHLYGRNENDDGVFLDSFHDFEGLLIVFQPLLPDFQLFLVF
jgi:hypothetical protein